MPLLEVVPNDASGVVFGENATASVVERSTGSKACVGLSNPAGVKWSLGYGGQWYDNLRHYSDGAHVKEALQFLDFPGVSHPEFAVAKSSRLGHGGFVWRVDLPWQTTTSGEKLLVKASHGGGLSSYSCAVQARIANNASLGLRGTMGVRLGADATHTMQIPANATAEAFKRALEEASNVTDVRVSVEILQQAPPLGNDARRWRVTFQSFADAGDLPLLRVDPPEGTFASVNVTELVKGKSAPVATISLTPGPSKTFTATYNGAEATAALSTNLTAAQYKARFQEAFESLRDTPSGVVKPARSPAFVDVQRRKTQLFVLFARGDPGLLTVSGDAAAAVTRDQSSVELLRRGNFTLEFGLDCEGTSTATICERGITRPIPVGANASDVESALEDLPEVLDVDVTRGFPRGAINGDVYAVTFRRLRLHAARDALIDDPRTWSREHSRLAYSPAAYQANGGGDLPTLKGALRVAYGRPSGELALQEDDARSPTLQA